MTSLTEHLTEEQLNYEIKRVQHLIEVGAVYAHYRNPTNLYHVKGLAIIEATQEVGVIYQKVPSPDTLPTVTWIRPISSWLEKVPFENALVPRFMKIKE